MKTELDLKLRIALKETKDYTRVHHSFVVIDLDVSKQYPQNFVCILPKTIQIRSNPTSAFEKHFQNESINVANQLLTKALKSRPDADIRMSIRERLKVLEPKKVNQVKCGDCGKLFEQKKRGYKKYTVCFECYQKRFAKK